MPAILTKTRHPLRNTYTSAHRAAGNGRKKPAPLARSGGLGMETAHVRRALAWLTGLAVVLAAFFGLSAGLMQLYRYCTTSGHFAIEDIRIDGISQLRPDEVIALSGLKKGDNCLSVHIPDIEKRLVQNPWIEKVSIKRELPHRFIISIQERNPQFWVLKNDSLYYLDKNGVLIAPVESQNFQSLPTLDIGAGGEEALPYLSDFMSQIGSAHLPFDTSQISWLRVSAGKGFELYWENKHLSLSIDFKQWQRNLRRLALTLDDIKKRNEIDKVREIRAADGQVWLEKI
ncbi:MAG: FtsQ-type POTRA domain-containing protein [Desulfovibrionaceae bacterium]|nr:FtsQ-type POTRA domain-containing protein [Desulfovibrionaceae bacterium]